MLRSYHRWMRWLRKPMLYPLGHGAAHDESDHMRAQSRCSFTCLESVRVWRALHACTLLESVRVCALNSSRGIPAQFSGQPLPCCLGAITS